MRFRCWPAACLLHSCMRTLVSGYQGSSFTPGVHIPCRTARAHNCWLSFKSSTDHITTWPCGAQTKETLSLRATSFGSKCELSDKFIKKVADSGVADGVLSFATFKQNKEMKKTDGAKRQRITGTRLLTQPCNPSSTLIFSDGEMVEAAGCAIPFT